MDYSSQSLYPNQRSSVAEGLHIGPVPGSYPVNNGQMGVHTPGVTEMPAAHMLGNHVNYSHNAFPIDASEHHYSQLPLRKEVDEEGRICSVATNVAPDPIPTEDINDRHEEGIETKIKSETEEDEAFVAAAHETLLQVSNKEITLEQAADILERPYSYVYRRYQEFCDKINGIKPQKKRRVSNRADRKKKRKTKRVKVVKRRRILSGEIYQCEVCPATFNRESQLKTHANVHSVENESHPCTACGVVFPKMTKLMRHRMIVHKDALQCPHCNAQFANIPAYSYHIKTHTRGERQFKCDECGKEFHAKSSLIKHEFIHTGERPYMCGYCEKTFITLSNLKSHYQIHTGGPPKPFECEECGKRFTANSSLVEHMNIHMKEKPYNCDECDAKFNFKQNLNRHKLVHSGETIEKGFKCEYCPAAFTLSTDLRRHTTVHTGNKPFKCDMCDFSCTRKTSFEYHQNIHSGKKPFECDVYGCTMAYSRPQSLQIHKLKHGPPPPVTCTECNEKFPDRTAMKRHMMIHTGEKPYACDQCEQICYDQADLKRHMFKHMYKPIKNKPKQIRPKKRYTQSKIPVTAEITTKKWTTNGYQVPEVATDVQNARVQHSAAAVSHYGWNTHAEDTNSQTAAQPAFNPFTASQYTNLASSIMDYRAPSLYVNQRSSVTEPAPGFIPINNTNSQMGVHTSGATGMPGTHMLGNQTNHANYSHNADSNNMSGHHYNQLPLRKEVDEDNADSNNMSEHHYNQLPLRKEVDEEEGICSEASNAIPDPLPTEGTNDELEEGLETKIKSETEEDDAFLVVAQDAFLQVKSKDITLHQAAIRLERPYSYVYKRYKEFCDNIDGIETESEEERRVIKKAKGRKKKRKTKRLKIVKSRPKLSGKIYQCEKCPATFYRDYQFKVHAKVHVEGNESHPCTACGVVFPKMQKLMLHRMTVHEEALQCPHCNQQFTHIRNYKYHMKTHTDGKPFKCDECGTRFIQKTSLKIHKRIHTGERPYMCGYCEKTFITISSLKQHHHMHTGTRAKPHECEECGKRYPSNSSLLEHMNIHKGERPLACDECDARFNFKQQLKRHKEVVHLGHVVEKPFKCNFCPGEFALSADLRRHTTVHTGNKPFKCNMCDFACTRKTSFEYHQYTHTGEKPFKCDFYGCTMEYNRPQSLKMHKLKHEPPPPVACKVCHEKFPDRVALKRHMIVHGEKVLVCDQCEQICYDQSALKRHMFKHMSKPFDNKQKQSRPKKRYTQPKKSVTAEPTIKKWPTNGYQVPEVATNAQNTHVQHSAAAPSHSAPSHTAPSHYTWNTHAEDTNSQPPAHSQPPFNPFTASQYTNLVNNAWPTAIDPDELRMRLLSSFK